MKGITIWHNPRCSKSRETLALLQDRGIDPNVRLYLQDSPTVEDIKEALQKLGKSAPDIVRRGEKAYSEAGLGRESSDEELIAAMATSPILIERPIVFAAGRAAVGRPPEAVLELL